MVASAGAAITLSCGGGPGGGPVVTGNLVPPPQVTVCVDAQPESASVMIDGAETMDGCTNAWLGNSIDVTVSADGYATHMESVIAEEGLVVAVELKPESETPAEPDGDDGGETEGEEAQQGDPSTEAPPPQ